MSYGTKFVISVYLFTFYVMKFSKKFKMVCSERVELLPFWASNSAITLARHLYNLTLASGRVLVAYTDVPVSMSKVYNMATMLHNTRLFYQNIRINPLYKIAVSV